MTTSKEYFAGMRETTSSIHGEISSILQSSTPGSSSCGFVNEAMLAYWKTRSGKFTSRAHVARLLYEEFASGDWRGIINILYALELQNISAHQANCAFDNKYVAGAGGGELQHVCAHLTLSLSQDLLSAAFEKSDEWYSVMRVFAQANRDIYLGQLIDLSILRLDDRTFSEESLEEKYIERCFLMGGGTYVPCVYPLYKSDACDDLRCLVVELLKCYGASAQIQNDLYNVIHGLERGEVPDDVVNSKLTYPVWILLSKTGLSTDTNIKETWEIAAHACARNETMVDEVRASSALLIKRRVWPKARYIIRKLKSLRGRSNADIGLQWLVEYFFTTKILRKSHGWNREA